MHICFFIERVGPYHAFRLQGLTGMKVSVVETRAGSQRYKWKETIEKHRFNVLSFESAGQNEIWSTLSSLAPNVVFLTGYGFKEMLWAMAWCILHHVPIVMQSDTTALDEKKKALKELVKRFLLSHIQAAFVAGTRSRAYMSALGVSEQAIFQPYDVVDNGFFSAFTEEPSPVQRPYFVCVSRLIPAKNLSFLLDAFALFTSSNEGVDLVILGNGELEKKLLKEVEQLGLSERVHFKGFLHMDEVRRYYKHASCLVLSSISEPWGLCVNEAIAAGLPVVVSERAGVAEDLVKDRETGLLFSPFDKETLVQSLKYVIYMTEAERLTMVQKAQALLEDFDRPAFIRGVEQAAAYALHYPLKMSGRRIRASLVIRIAKLMQ